MNNQPNTQERSPKLAESDSSVGRRATKLPLSVYPWLLVVGLGAILIAIAAAAVFSLTNTGKIEKVSTKQSTIFNQKTTTTQSKSHSSPNWLLTIFLLGAGVAGAVVIYKWRSHLPTITRRELTRRQQRKKSLQQGSKSAMPPTTKEIALENNSLFSDFETIPEVILEDLPVEPILIDVTPTIAILPPEQIESSNLDSQSLAEMMDIRKHLSLAAILQDFRRRE